MSLQKDFQQPDIETWLSEEVKGESFSDDPSLQEDANQTGLDYEGAIEVGGANAVWEPYFQTPEEKALEQEQLADYAGTHEQFE